MSFTIGLQPSLCLSLLFKKNNILVPVVIVGTATKSSEALKSEKSRHRPEVIMSISKHVCKPQRCFPSDICSIHPTVFLFILLAVGGPGRPSTATGDLVKEK